MMRKKREFCWRDSVEGNAVEHLRREKEGARLREEVFPVQVPILRNTANAILGLPLLILWAWRVGARSMTVCSTDVFINTLCASR